MTTDEDLPPLGGQLRDEAADWFATMRGPEADARRAEFEAWLARGALHRTAYNRIAETFSLGKGLKDPLEAQVREPEADAESPSSGTTRRQLAAGGVVAALIAGTAVLGTHIFLPDRGNHQLAQTQPREPAPATTQLATRIGEIKSFRLADGSMVALDSDGLVVVSITHSRRDLHLVRGRARFTVAHDPRPFVVAVAGGTVTARGTIFDVELGRDNTVRVRLLRGFVDVEMPAKVKGATLHEESTHMKAGEMLTFREVPSAGDRPSQIANPNWPDGVTDLDRVRLADLIAEANHYATKPLILASADLRDLRLSGTFRVRDTRKLAENIGDLLGLVVIDRADAFVLARWCPATPQGNCRSPS
ncbi:DUF4880 domain-containing protein [Sphingomonas histidinilytica]|uniref:FecR family protein n=1 Tax=Rhizorhabdus histidinilytica TaxID=439228 RepID=UPI001ADB9B28|nr:FecR domain-containing protein [Rhizorhabdus histidinilytica]MBO9375569.1 DUF4880 domain-containing protein [Rhizorhabdus histidinilytica]